jgi:hypothetical protein
MQAPIVSGIEVTVAVSVIVVLWIEVIGTLVV